MLGPKGYGAVQVAPPADWIKPSGAHPWWEVYQPVSYGLDSLGSRAPASAVPLSSANYPNRTGSVTLPADTAFEYEYVVKDAPGKVTWESGANRTANSGSAGSLSLNESWKQRSGPRSRAALPRAARLRRRGGGAAERRSGGAAGRRGGEAIRGCGAIRVTRRATGRAAGRVAGIRPAN
ncbi:hypothetical protein J2S46_007496 [Kitasatospora herbaricolor]|uniref:carbohydrate-binding module family 20 domain-containing protein n=1 Tax=Kitasatospora herbaricolor TaxID=68217 RepID=UPI001E526646|nr:carbohydrate-binding module family 20 domain-containing protein [Kitasatospora herbaricolor]MDQ0312940.1 hypothetical protein [Kitasatospora herbaricolor]